MTGSVLFGVGIFLSAFAGESLPLLYVTYGVVSAAGGGLGLIAPIAVLPGWFPDRPGLAYGLALLGFGTGTVVSVPVISVLLSATGGPFPTFGVLGLSYVVLLGGAAAAAASAFVVVISLADTAGRLFWPILSDRIGGANVFLAMFVLQGAAFLLMPVLGAGSFAVLCALASVVTACYGGGYATMSALSAAYYGPRDMGAIFGSIITASAFAGFGAPLLLARSADLTGSYDPALYTTGALMLIGALIPLALRPPAVLDEPKPPKETAN